MTTEPQLALIKRTTITELCVAWNASAEQIKRAFAELVEARQRLVLAFGNEAQYRDFRISDSYQRSGVDFTKPDDTLTMLKQDAWKTIIDRLELRKIMSLARIADLDKQLEDPKQLPDITEANITAMLETNLNLMGQHMEEKVRECYEKLRPGGWSRSKYKTNEKSFDAGVGRKLILAYRIRGNYSGGYEVNYGGARDELRALDHVFHMLDGKPIAAAFDGEICEAIGKTKSGESAFDTTYFKGRCFSNCNLHLEFKREDLLQQFNLVAGGARINVKRNGERNE